MLLPGYSQDPGFGVVLDLSRERWGRCQRRATIWPWYNDHDQRGFGM